MSKKKTNKEFQSEVYSLIGDEYIFLEEYQTASKKLKCKHIVCGYEWEISPHNFLNGKRCPNCAGNIKKTTKTFAKEVDEVTKHKFLLVSDYKGNKEDVVLKCKACGTLRKIRPSILNTQGIKCKNCSHLKPVTFYPKNMLSDKKKLQLKVLADINRLTQKEFSYKFEKLVNGTYTLLSEYKGSKFKIKVRHNKCGKVYDVDVSKFMYENQRCNECTRHISPISYKEQFDKLNHQNYTLLSTYRGSKENVFVRCNKCGKSFYKRADMMLQGIGCPYCNQSHGERYISDYLTNNNIKYIAQYRNKACKDKRMLPFDFYLPDKNILIEYDGIQHYEVVNYFGGSDEFESIKKRDNIKTAWAKNNNIKLIRIPYTCVGKTLSVTLDNLLGINGIEFKTISYSDTKDVLYNKHYLHRMPNISYAFGMFYKNYLCGVITYGSSGSPTLAKSLTETNYKDVIELNRLYVDDFISEGIYDVTSKFVAWSLKQIGNHVVVSFADSGMNHFGTIYQATNFMYVGETREQWDAYIGENKHSRAWVKGHKYKTKKLRTAKYEYIYITGNKRYKKDVVHNLKKKSLPYPKGVSGRYNIGDSKPEVLKTI